MGGARRQEEHHVVGRLVPVDVDRLRKEAHLPDIPIPEYGDRHHVDGEIDANLCRFATFNEGKTKGNARRGDKPRSETGENIGIPICHSEDKTDEACHYEEHGHGTQRHQPFGIIKISHAFFFSSLCFSVMQKL